MKSIGNSIKKRRSEDPRVSYARNKTLGSMSMDEKDMGKTQVFKRSQTEALEGGEQDSPVTVRRKKSGNVENRYQNVQMPENPKGI